MQLILFCLTLITHNTLSFNLYTLCLELLSDNQDNERRHQMNYDFSLLRRAITQNYDTQEEFAKKLCISPRGLSLKLNGKVPWKQTEISLACDFLGISSRDIPIYFFREKANNTLDVEQIRNALEAIECRIELLLADLDEQYPENIRYPRNE